MKEIPENSSLDSPILALDLGQKRVGVAVSDSLGISITQLAQLKRSNWKQLLSDVSDLIRRFDAKTLVIGLPTSLDGSQGSSAKSVQQTALKFAQSLEVPVYLQDERLSSVEAEQLLRAAGYSNKEIMQLVDGQAAAIVLADFLPAGQQRILVSRPLKEDPVGA